MLLGTERYGPSEADSDGRMLSPSDECCVGGPLNELCWRIGIPLLKSRSSPSVDTASSASDPEVTDSSYSTSEKSLPDDSVAVDGSYSCFSGDDDLRGLLKNAGVKEGIDPSPPLRVGVDGSPLSFCKLAASRVPGGDRC